MLISYTTDRLIITILQPSQADMVLNFYKKNRSFLEKYEPLRPHNFYTYKYHQTNLSCEYSSFFNHSYMRYWLFLKDDHTTPIGSICFSNFKRGAFCSCMAGYKLDEDFCHKGYMYEALSFLIPIVCTTCKIHRIEAMVMPDNFPSIKLLERLNFENEGYLRDFAQINGKWEDHYLFTYLHEMKPL